MKITQQAADPKAGMTLDEAAQTSPYLPQAPRANRLPPKWDGATVEWEEWEVDLSSWRFHVKLDPYPYCGSTDERVMAIGRVRNDGPARSIQSARGYRLGRMSAYRCTGCWHDQVIDLAGALWDLDDSDYDDDGSWPR